MRNGTIRAKLKRPTLPSLVFLELQLQRSSTSRASVESRRAAREPRGLRLDSTACASYGSRHIFSLLPSLPAHPPTSIFTICRIWNLNRLGSDGKFPSLAISPGSFAASVDSRQGGSGEPGHLPREDLTSRTPYVVSCDYGNPR